MKRQYCASVFVIDFDLNKVLLMYNKKLNKWLQPGGHIEDDILELPWEAAVREVLEETGVEIKLIGNSYDGKNIEPIAVSHYENKVGDMVDIQYLAVPINKGLHNQENNKVMWVSIDDLNDKDEVDEEIKIKVKTLVKNYR